MDDLTSLVWLCLILVDLTLFFLWPDLTLPDQTSPWMIWPPFIWNGFILVNLTLFSLWPDPQSDWLILTLAHITSLPHYLRSSSVLSTNIGSMAIIIYFKTCFLWLTGSRLGELIWPDNGWSVQGHNDEAEEGGPQANPQTQRQVVESILAAPKKFSLHIEPLKKEPDSSRETVPLLQ